MKRSGFIRRTAYLARSWIKRGTKRINPISKKKAARQIGYRKLVELVIGKAHGRCKIRIFGICTKWAQGLHHKLSRAQGGEDTEANCIAACNACNLWVHDHFDEAVAMGHVIPGNKIK